MKRLIGALCVVLCLGALGYSAFQPHEVEIARYSTTLVDRSPSQQHNALLALRKLNGAVIQPGETFSFNARIGTFSRDQGYRKAPVSYNGQLIDSWGGGVCQTSTTTYNAALLAGMKIVERNRHRFAPSYAPPGRDAAVAFNSIDLRFSNPYSYPVRIQAAMRQDKLEVTFIGPPAKRDRPEIVTEVRKVQEAGLYTIGKGVRHGRVRNSGKPGWDVAVYRITGQRKELISTDSYPSMARVLQTR